LLRGVWENAAEPVNSTSANRRTMSRRIVRILVNAVFINRIK
jgi:hypothetical protein